MNHASSISITAAFFRLIGLVYKTSSLAPFPEIVALYTAEVQRYNFVTFVMYAGLIFRYIQRINGMQPHL